MNEECAIGDIMNRRHFARMKAEEISALFDMKEILVAIETDKKTFVGSIVNISPGGVSVKISSLVPIDFPLCISFNLGKKNIIVRAMAKYICKIGDNYITGVIFTNIDRNTLQYIDGIFCINALLKDIGAIQHKTISFCCTSQHPYFRKQLNGHGTQSNAW